MIYSTVSHLQIASCVRWEESVAQLLETKVMSAEKVTIAHWERILSSTHAQLERTVVEGLVLRTLVNVSSVLLVTTVPQPLSLQQHHQLATTNHTKASVTKTP